MADIRMFVARVHANPAITQGRLTEAFLRAPPLSRLVMEVAA